LLSRLNRPFPRATVAHVHQLADGNPFFALEIGRHLVNRGLLGTAGPLPIPDNLKELVGERLAPLPAPVHRVLLVVAALSNPTIQLVQAVVPDAMAGLERAVEAQVLDPTTGRIRFAHPIIGSVVYAEATDEERRALHAKLATLPLGPEERARHRALAAIGPDAEVALALDVGARAANARGAPDAAAALAEQGRDLTPVDRPEDALRRAIDAADYHLRAGATARARDLLMSLVPNATGQTRANALQRLGKIEFTDGTLPEAERMYREALDQAGDDHRLRAVLERDLTNALLQQGHVETALEHIGNLEALGRRMDDAPLVDRARTMRTFANGVLGHGLPADLRAHAVALAEGAAAIGPEQNPGVQHPLLDWGVILKWSDDFDHARSLFKAVLRTAEGRDESARAPALFHLGELESWAGDWLLADVYAEECRKAILQTGQSAYRRLPLTLTGFLAAYRGDLDTAQVAAETALGEARRVGDMPYAQRNLRTLGVIELSRSRMDRADDWFRQLRDLLRIQKNREPGITRSAGDEIEVLIALGRLVEAGSLTECLEERGRTLDRAFAQATGARCRGLLLAATGDVAGALAALDRALEAHQRLPQPFELARTLMARGTVQRRGKQKRAARESLQQATEIFERLGASVWVQRARAELERTGGSPAARHELTPTEARIAEMVAAGRTNREVSAQLFLSVKTVEANLSRIYGKLAVRSRSELAARLAKSVPP
jgi:DNA-binding CsgD family transcriptional regulator